MWRAFPTDPPSRHAASIRSSFAPNFLQRKTLRFPRASFKLQSLRAFGSIPPSSSLSERAVERWSSGSTSKRGVCACFRPSLQQFSTSLSHHSAQGWHREMYWENTRAPFMDGFNIVSRHDRRSQRILCSQSECPVGRHSRERKPRSGRDRGNCAKASLDGAGHADQHRGSRRQRFAGSQCLLLGRSGPGHTRRLAEERRAQSDRDRDARHDLERRQLRDGRLLSR